jgi:beta-lactamase regulating signal transducer with metallopeptidase domain
MSGATWIPRWNEVAAHWSEAMWRSCWQGGLFALLIWVICQSRPRIPTAMRYRLWWLVCLKLVIGLCPIFLLLPLLPPTPPALPVAATRQDAPLQMAAPPPVTMHPMWLHAPASGIKRPGTSLSAAAWLMGGWLVATGMLVALSARSFRRLLRLLHQSEPLSDPALLSIAREAVTAMAVRGMPRILVTQADAGVLTLSAWKPIVLLSQQTLTCCTPSELRLVLAHEFAHIRRGDAWLGLLPQLTQILFCFFPPAWLACREVDLAREIACDEQTLYALQARSDDYGRLLLKLGARYDPWFSLCTPGVSSHFRVLHRRLSMLQQMTERSPRRLRGRAIMLVCLIGAAVAAPWSLVHAQNPGPSASNINMPMQAVSHDNTASSSGQRAANGNTPGGDTKVIATHVRQQTGTASLSAAKDKTLLVPALIKLAALAPASRNPGRQNNLVAVTAVPRNRSVVANSANSVSITRPGSEEPSTEPVAGRIDPAKPEPEQKLETKLFKLHFASAEVVTKTLAELFAAPAPNTTKILSDMRTNTVIVQANAARLQEISNVLNQLDVSTPPEGITSAQLEVFPLKFARVVDLARTLTVLFGDKKETVKIVPDERTNSLIIQCSVEKYDEIINLIRHLDVKHE